MIHPKRPRDSNLTPYPAAWGIGWVQVPEPEEAPSEAGACSGSLAANRGGLTFPKALPKALAS
jgi:hypothetical protein